MSKAIGRDNIYREITDKIIAELERGIVPWVQPWTSTKQLCPLGLPVNGLTSRSYSGINILLLWSALEERGFASPYWVTFKQCIAMGGSVRKGEKGIPTSVALFDLGQYQGEIITDLFGEEQFFGNVDGFWVLQDAAINAKRDDCLAHGWTRVEVMPRGTRFYEWEYQKTPKKKGGAVWIVVSERGEVETHEGYVSRDEVRKRQKQERGETETLKAAKPELTAPMQNYVELHRLAAIRLELLNHPQVALRLTLAHMIVGSSLWNVKPEPMKPAKPDIGESVATNPATTYFEERRTELLTSLGFEEERGNLVQPNGDEFSLARLFAQLLKLSDDDVLRLTALAMAETLAAGTATAELAGAVTGATLNDWRPDDIFFDLLNGKDVVNALLSDVGTSAIAEANNAEPAKVQKGIIKDIMRGDNGRDQNADWSPGYFRFPPMAHSPRGGIAIVDKWESVAGLIDTSY